MRTRIVAHRGRLGAGVENAVEGLDALPGWIDGVEVDARCSADGVPFLMHDPDLGRTSGTAGRVAELAAGELERRPLGELGTVPRLSAYLVRAAATDLDPVLVDVKSDDPVSVDAVVRVASTSPVAGRTIVLVRSVDGLARARAAARSQRLGLLGLTTGNLERALVAAQRHRAELLLVRHGDDAYLRNRELVAIVRAAGLQVGASTVNGEGLAAALADCVDLLLTDRADEPRRPREGACQGPG